MFLFCLSLAYIHFCISWWQCTFRHSSANSLTIALHSHTQHCVTLVFILFNSWRRKSRRIVEKYLTAYNYNLFYLSLHCIVPWMADVHCTHGTAYSVSVCEETWCQRNCSSTELYNYETNRVTFPCLLKIQDYSFIHSFMHHICT